MEHIQLILVIVTISVVVSQGANSWSVRVPRAGKIKIVVFGNGILVGYDWGYFDSLTSLCRDMREESLSISELKHQSYMCQVNSIKRSNHQ